MHTHIQPLTYRYSGPSNSLCHDASQQYDSSRFVEQAVVLRAAKGVDACRAAFHAGAVCQQAHSCLKHLCTRTHTGDGMAVI